MANPPNYHRNGNHSYYPSLPSISREMGPPMDFPPQPMEIDLNISRSGLPQAFGEISYASPNVAKVAPKESYSRPQDPITKWYHGNDGPWVPHTAIPDIVGERLPSKHSYRQPNPSEAGSSFPYNVPHSDSGYGTRRSVGNTSVFSVDPDCQSLTSHITDYPQPFQGINEVIQQRDARVNEAWGVTSDIHHLVCPTCAKTVKTQSELKKHTLRHTKPFVCDVQGCARVEGFSTTNDLERHTKSKHPLAIAETPTKRYRCCVSGCKSREKSWPRLDNFRSHLRRVHSQVRGQQLVDMVRRAEFWEAPLNMDQELVPQMSIPQPRIAQDSSRFAERRREADRGPEFEWIPLHMEVNEPTQDVIRPLVLDNQVTMAIAPCGQSPLPEVPESETETVQPVNIFQRPSTMPEVRTTLLARVSESETPNPTPSQEKATRQTLAAEATITEVIKSIFAGPNSLERTGSGDMARDLPSGRASPQNTWPNDPRAASSQASNSSTNHADSPLSESIDCQAQSKALQVIRLLQEHGYTVQKSEPVVEPTVPQNAGSAACNKSENQVTCQTCKKFRGRPCELKKHMKRHERPYGCTFSTCSKTFGSKNDWKRHENSQHFHLETWRCDEERPESEGSAVCTKVCYRRQTFQDHLNKAHKITADEKIKAKLEACRIGRNCQARFWCGFCDKTVELTRKGLDAWTERFDHIDDHFMGRHGMEKQSILDWTPLDGDKSKPQTDLESLGEKDSPSSSGTEIITTESSGMKRSRSSEEINDGTRKAKHSKPSAAVVRDILVYCCQCETPHNPKFNQSCLECPDSHPFCSSCVVRDEVRRSDS